MMRPMSSGRAIALGGLAVGVLDLADALIFFGLRGAAPMRICQSIAAGLLGRAAFQGGWSTAALGVALHFLIATIIVAVLVIASRWMPPLARRPWVIGPIYGVIAFLVMNLVVVPLSAASGTFPQGAPLVNGVLIHMFGVGVPAAYAARAARRA
jgi:hypothetical protein